MAKKDTIKPQEYPRLSDSRLDDSKLQQHIYKIPLDELKKIIRMAIEDANKKSSREILNIPEGLSESELQKAYRKGGQELFKYFRKSYSDPAVTAYECLHRDYREVGREQFRSQRLQRIRMNSGWKYQFIAKDLASASKRFVSVSEIGGAKQTDFNAQINRIDENNGSVSLYVSVKNKSDTVGGQDFPNAVDALEKIARLDKNKRGPYLCVFGITMEIVGRHVRVENSTNRPYSVNTEIWGANYFWPFFSAYSYREIMQAVLEVLQETAKPDPLENIVPDELLNAFGACCIEKELVDANGKFNDAKKLVDFFVRE